MAFLTGQSWDTYVYLNTGAEVGAVNKDSGTVLEMHLTRTL